jgi:hypothetical protein
MTIDLNATAERISSTLRTCAQDWREEILADAIARLRRRHRELNDRDIAALILAVRALAEPGNRGSRTWSET